VNSSDNFFRRFAVAVAVVATCLLFGANGAQAASTQVLAGSGSLVAEEHDTGDEETDEPSDEEESDDPQQDNEDSEDSDDEDSDDEDSDTEEPTDEPTDEPTFTDPTPTDTTDVTEMPTEDAGATSEAGPSPLGWVLLAGGVASAIAAVLIYRRNRPF